MFKKYIKDTFSSIPLSTKIICLILLILAVIAEILNKTGHLPEYPAAVPTSSSLGSNINLNEKITTVKGKDLPIYNVDTTDNAISLSFDAAWGADDTIKILDILDKYNTKVTFFMTGEWVSNYPDMVKEIYNRGHDLGNHSNSHKQMSKLDTKNQTEEIMTVHNKVKELTNYDMFLFRPPYGDYNSQLIKTTYSLNYYPIQWSVDSLDWKDYGVDAIIKRVTDNKALKNGAIILCHNGAKYTSDALDLLLKNLTDKGYKIVPISQLIIKDNFYMDATGCQKSL